MELQTLNADFHPDTVIDSYETLIWTERYSTAGDFQLTFNNIAEALTILPEGSYVTLRESTVPMKVETHKIEKKAGETPVLTTTGRSCEACWIEQRIAVKDLPSSGARPAWTLQADKESDAAYKAIRTVIGDQARSQAGAVVLDLLAPSISPNRAIPQLDLVLPDDYSTGLTNTYEIKADNLYTVIMELITTNRHGIRSIRPAEGSDLVIVEIYNGVDRTEDIVFDARFDQIDDATYLMSNQGSTNLGLVYGPNGSQQVLKTAAPEPAGLERRELLVDSSGTTPEIRTNQGLVELYKYNATALFDGQIAEQVAQDYNENYFLGDILKLTGQYGLSENVRVAEFIRSFDNTGIKAYPTFEAITD